MSADTKTKKGSMKGKGKSAMKSGATPIPTGPGSMASCGHSKCGLNCNVHYVGATTHIRDHHMFHAARGVGNIWAAAIVTGLSVVLTGAVAYSAVQAKEEMPVGARAADVRADTNRILQRLAMMEKALQDVRVLCAARPTTDEATTEKKKTVEKPTRPTSTTETIK